MLTPCGTGCEDAWLATASLIPLTRRIKFLVAFRPGARSPRPSRRRWRRRTSGSPAAGSLVNIVTGAEPAELARFGVHDDKDTRYEQTGEFLEIVRGAWSGEPFTFKGHHYEVTGRDDPRATRPGARDLLRRRLARGRAGRGEPRRRVPRLG